MAAFFILYPLLIFDYHEAELPLAEPKCSDIARFQESTGTSREGRIVYSSTTSEERYYLRMLLNVVRGAKSFEELMTVNKQTYTTFKVACFAYGLLNDGKECRPLQLWEENWTASSEDIFHKTRILYKYPATRQDIKRYIGIQKYGKRKPYIWRDDSIARSMRVNEYSDNEEIDLRKQNFNRWVLAVGAGKLPAKKKETEDEPTWIEILEEFLIKSQTKESYLKERAILTPKNDDADAINEFMFKKLGGVLMTYYSVDEICKASTDTEDQHHLYPVEFLNTLNFSGMPPHALYLKRKLPIMLIRNINPTLGLFNVTRLIITDLFQFVIQAKILTGSHIEESVLIHRIVLTSTQTKWPFMLKRRQFPLKPCYAMTINKS
ncbi:ATP-dependent DNA helicase PIF1-like protein [Tanacetum coccineum]